MGRCDCRRSASRGRVARAEAAFVANTSSRSDGAEISRGRSLIGRRPSRRSKLMRTFSAVTSRIWDPHQASNHGSSCSCRCRCSYSLLRSTISCVCRGTSFTECASCAHISHRIGRKSPDNRGSCQPGEKCFSSRADDACIVHIGHSIRVPLRLASSCLRPGFHPDVASLWFSAGRRERGSCNLSISVSVCLSPDSPPPPCCLGVRRGTAEHG